MEKTPKLKRGPVSPRQFDELTDEQLKQVIRGPWEGFFPGKEFCFDYTFYLHDGGYYNFLTGQTEGWRD